MRMSGTDNITSIEVTIPEDRFGSDTLYEKITCAKAPAYSVPKILLQFDGCEEGARGAVADEDNRMQYNDDEKPTSTSGKIRNYIHNMSTSDVIFIAVMLLVVLLAITVPLGVIMSSQSSSNVENAESKAYQNAVDKCDALFPQIEYVYPATPEPTQSPTLSSEPTQGPTLTILPTITPKPTEGPTKWETYTPTTYAPSLLTTQRRHLAVDDNNVTVLQDDGVVDNNNNSIPSSTTTIDDGDIVDSINATTETTAVEDDDIPKKTDKWIRERNRLRYEKAGHPRAPPEFDLVYANTPDPDPAIDTSTRYNYNTSPGSSFGPATWGSIDISDMDDSPHEEMIDHWEQWNYTENRCDIGPQSPIDLCTDPTRYCQEFHEIRTKGGTVKMSDMELAQSILPNKLRVDIWPREEGVPTWKGPPSVDFPWVNLKVRDLYNIDIKIPSEHTICGKRYDAEMMYMTHHNGPNAEGMLVYVGVCRCVCVCVAVCGEYIIGTMVRCWWW